MQFRSVIQLNKINPYVLVEAGRARRLKPGWRKPMPVLVQVNGEPNPPWRVNMMPMGDGGFYLYLNGVVRKASGTGVGDRVEVTVTFDEGYRGGPMHEAPPGFADGLRSDPGAQAAWDKLPPSLRKEVLRYFAALKSDEARTSNVEKAIRVLSGSKERFLGRDWNGRFIEAEPPDIDR